MHTFALVLAFVCALLFVWSLFHHKWKMSNHRRRIQERKLARKRKREEVYRQIEVEQYLRELRK